MLRPRRGKVKKDARDAWSRRSHRGQPAEGKHAPRRQLRAM